MDGEPLTRVRCPAVGELVDVAIADGVATITLDSQHNRNALSRQLVAELAACLDEAEAADPRAIVLTHRGPTFCAGADLKERSEAGGPPDSRPIVDVMRRLMDTPRPTIAAVDGAVRAGGIGLMAACDLVVVDAAVTFAFTEVQIGVAPAIISVPILRRVAPSSIASAMLTGEPLDATEARRIGLVTHVAADVAATVTSLCAAIRAASPVAVAETKQLLSTVPALGRDEAFDAMRALSDRLFAGPHAAEGMAAFREKRPPVWPA